ncbi:phage tail terminator protein [Variovorax boronicumulans]|uniref:phage tail terminator protein n=1 Tax=Variovorax boronicumulans TaxID=436515 RepID=UPI001C57112F
MNLAENDFLSVEPLMVARLNAALSGLSPAVHVLTAADLADVAEARQPVPAVHVIYDGFRVVEARGDGLVYRLEHTWLAVTATRNVANTRTGAAARRDASALMAKAGAALAGFVPTGFSNPLRVTTPPRPGFRTGYQYLPLAFLHQTFFHASPP